MDRTPHLSGVWSIRLAIRAELNGEALVDASRVALLQAIDRTSSISAAARQLGISYRYAWLLVRSMNQAAESPLVESIIGGRRGGGARLTEGGHLAVTVFGELQRTLQDAAAQALPRAFEAAQRENS